MSLETPAGVKNPSAPKFSWDYDVPEIPFWSDLKYTTGRNFLQCYNEGEIMAMDPDFDGMGSAVKQDKLRFLLEKLRGKFSSRDAAAGPRGLAITDYPQWMKLTLARMTVLSELGMQTEQEAAIQAMMDTPNPAKPGVVNISAVNMMAALKEEQGLFAEAEELSRKVVPVFDEMMGADSPPSQGARRNLISCIWKAGKPDEAKRLAEETRLVIDAMGEKQSQYLKYQDDERKYLDEAMADLEAWGAKET
ncbi:hypothetical protein KVR01_001284 [Diaporthe batatas]|uniref:uncharacterized protein n=1 Tax=Diaporthe batatas TaxID=748121 RepID=UPI001D047597|nr:uncharacterized protein KVR01_001284 [Diaporthe batatas]KAG8168535.1 hypothetical protein KVR01_001284 [Diaporthe batatas]